jgi:hypothetical protein
VTRPEDWSHDIPASERILEFVTNRSEEDIFAIYEQVAKARTYILNNL